MRALIIENGAVANAIALPASAEIAADGKSASWPDAKVEGGVHVWAAPDGATLYASDTADIGWGVSSTGVPVAPPAPVLPPPDAAQLVAYAAARRFAVETGGLKVNGLTIATDRDSQSMIANAYAGMQASGAESVKFKATSGWIELSADQIKAIALAVFAHVQACFAAEDGCDAGINASPPTIATFAEVDAAFASLAAA